VPDPENLQHSNDAIEFERATVLYADLSGSTSMVDSKSWTFAAEIYKAFLYCAARLIADSGGEITAYDGDRIMAVFIDGGQSTNAAKCALKIHYATKNIIMPALKNQYPEIDPHLAHSKRCRESASCTAGHADSDTSASHSIIRYQRPCPMTGFDRYC
jgi:hypothetical protein